MSTYLIPSVIADDVHVLNHTVVLLQRYCRHPAVMDNRDGTKSMVFEPDLTLAEEATLSKVLAAVEFNLFITPDDYEAIRAEVPALRAYYSDQNLTGDETVMAVKAIIRVLRALLRD